MNKVEKMLKEYGASYTSYQIRINTNGNIEIFDTLDNALKRFNDLENAMLIIGVCNSNSNSYYDIVAVNKIGGNTVYSKM